MCTGLLTSVITGAQSERVTDNQSAEAKALRTEKSYKNQRRRRGRQKLTDAHHVRGGTAKQAAIPSIAELWLAM